MKAVIKKVTRKDQLSVAVAIVDTVDGQEVTLQEANYGFPLETDATTIQAEVKKALATFKSDRANAERTAKLDEVNEKADETIKLLENLSVDDTEEIVKENSDEATN